MRPKLVSGRVKDFHTPERSFVLYVYDNDHKLIMWCGPMSRGERTQLIEVFRAAGWTTRD